MKDPGALTRWEKFWCLLAVAIFPAGAAAGVYAKVDLGEALLWAVGATAVAGILIWEHGRHA